MTLSSTVLCNIVRNSALHGARSHEDQGKVVSSLAAGRLVRYPWMLNLAKHDLEGWRLIADKDPSVMCKSVSVVSAGTSARTYIPVDVNIALEYTVPW